MCTELGFGWGPVHRSVAVQPDDAVAVSDYVGVNVARSESGIGPQECPPQLRQLDSLTAAITEQCRHTLESITGLYGMGLAPPKSTARAGNA